ncbi:hypothetical protein B0T22DRAFT_61102 [Podospora appendiculata]|uniref:Uncharacterized protein n=1 Tax=Podospora appendiculata TaxID=314037 RepID=A0AAE0XJJ2_9PEZI|nr:hypothetical protein B0T22DRAFT_61102 [Podospora appendiculata]
MGASMSTLSGWAIIMCIAGLYAYRHANEQKKREAARQRHDRPASQIRKEPKEKNKRLRGEAHSKDVEDSDKAAKLKARAQKPAPKQTLPPTTSSSQAVNYSSDDGVDNREFARQLASIKQGTNINAPKKTEEKRQKSVKQSRARVIEEKVNETKVSAPSSTAGADADDDESALSSPEVKAADSRDVTDMLEPAPSGPSVLRLTGTDKIKQKEMKAKAPEKVETKKQRQNRLKTEAAKADREEAEKQRQVALEAQRRLARISEGRAAKDGSAFMAAQAAQSVWKDKAANGNPSLSNIDFIPVQPLETFDTSSHTDVSVSSVVTPAPSRQTTVPLKSKAAVKPDNWIASLPSEEEQMELLLGEEEWSTVTTKKPGKSKKEVTTAESTSGAESTAKKAAPAASEPAASKTKTQKSNGTGKPAKTFTQPSSFAALSTNDDLDVENEWDV